MPQKYIDISIVMHCYIYFSFIIYINHLTSHIIKRNFSILLIIQIVILFSYVNFMYLKSVRHELQLWYVQYDIRKSLAYNIIVGDYRI